MAPEFWPLPGERVNLAVVLEVLVALEALVFLVFLGAMMLVCWIVFVNEIVRRVVVIEK